MIGRPRSAAWLWKNTAGPLQLPLTDRLLRGAITPWGLAVAVVAVSLILMACQQDGRLNGADKSAGGDEVKMMEVTVGPKLLGLRRGGIEEVPGGRWPILL